MRKEALAVIGIGAALSGGCISPSTEAFTTPIGIFYSTPEAARDPKIVAHEQEHWRQFQSQGIIFWFKYAEDPKFACEMEAEANLVAGYTNIFDHPACDKLK